jgi:hypothetical protein
MDFLKKLSVGAQWALKQNPARDPASGYRDSRLFPEFDKIKNEFNIHPNKRGMGVLAKVYIYFIHSRWFNPMGY